MSSPAGNVSYGYDGYGNPQSVSSTPFGTTPGITQQITTTRTFPSGRISWYGNGYTGELWNFDYDSAGRVTRKWANAGLQTLYGYDTWGRANSISHRNGSNTVLRSETYTYEGSRVKTKNVNGTVTTYGYDGAGQLASESRPGYSASYTYDANGNRLTRTVNGSTDTYSYTGNRLDSIARTGGTYKLYSYDSSGRVSGITGFDNSF